jgi:hypothetical protein
MRSRYALEQTPEQEEYELRMAEIKANKLAKQNKARTSTKSTEITKSHASKILLEMQELEQKIPNEKSRQEKLKMQLRLKDLGNLLPQIQSTENDFVDLGGSSGLNPDSYSKNRTGVLFREPRRAYASKQRNNNFATDPQAGKAWAIQNSQSRQLNHNKTNNRFTTNNEMNERLYNEARSVSPKGMSGSKRKRRTKRRKKTKKKRRTKRR